MKQLIITDVAVIRLKLKTMAERTHFIAPKAKTTLLSLEILVFLADVKLTYWEQIKYFTCLVFAVV
jgi:hypothetical protein